LTSFRVGAQLRRMDGTVYINVVIDENGRAQRADLQRSSGYRKLDRAATRSALENWVFDVSACERKDLPVTHVVAVEYHNDTY
jgi:TonB family protein